MKKILNILLLGMMIMTVSCKSFLDEKDELRINPNAPLDADATNMFQGILVADQFTHTGEVARLVGMYTNHFSGLDRQYVNLEDWNTLTSGDLNGPWGDAYASVIQQSKIIQNKADNEVNPQLKGAAQVVEAHMMGTVTSLWGDAPYSEAADIENFQNPSYDDQADIYADLQLLLDEAITNLSDPLGSISATKDIWYGGNTSAWIELAHSLKARFYLHVEDYANANLEAQLGISSQTNDLIADFGSTYGGDFNPYYSFSVYDRAGYMGAADAYAPSIMDPTGYFTNTYGYNRNHSKHNEADRFLYYYQPYEQYTGGYELAYFNGFDWGTATDGIFGGDFPLVTYGEMLLIQAEYEARTNGLTAGVTAYNTYRQLVNTGYGFVEADYYGLTFGSSFFFDDFVDVDFNPGGLEDPSSTAATPVEALLREIYEERYVVFTGNVESWTDIRRTDNIAEIQFKGYSGIPERLLYPQSEVNSNTNTPNPVPTVTTPTDVHM